MKSSIIPVGSVAAVLFTASSFASAASLVDFKPAPTTPILSEFDFSPGGGGGLFNGAGTIFGGPGGGLFVETPLLITQAIPGKFITPQNTTQFSNTSLYFTSANGAANTIFDPFLGALSYQLLITGTFAIYAEAAGNTTRGAGAGAVLLLHGQLGTAAITGALNGFTASVRDNFVTYDGGVIFDTLKASLATNATVIAGSLSFSLNDLNTPWGNGLPFASNATGLFSTPIIPEPGQATIFGGAMVALSFRRRNRKAA